MTQRDTAPQPAIWTESERVNERLVAILNEEYRDGTSPAAILAGYLLGFVSIARTLPANVTPPPSLAAAYSAAEVAAKELLHEFKGDPPDHPSRSRH